MVAAFEERHEVALPAEYRLFITSLGDGGAGPGYGLSRLTPSCCTFRRSGHLSQPSPYVPGPRYPGDWELRYEDVPGPGSNFLRGTLDVAGHGCSLTTQLIVTGPARGRLYNVDSGSLGGAAPYVVEDPDFLAWYERWLDDVLAGYDVGWFGERLPLSEAALMVVLRADPSPERRVRAASSLLDLPSHGPSARSAMLEAMTSDPDATVRARVCRLLSLDASVDAIEAYARSQTPPDLDALSALRRLTFADLLAELDTSDPDRRRKAAYLTQRPWEYGGDEPSALAATATTLLHDPDPLMRAYGAVIVDFFDLDAVHPLLRDLLPAEPDGWVRHHIERGLAERPPAFEPSDSLEPPF
ncbi:hypothetical protein [Dactylosporangium sp. CS-033363]|uniref:hypothetical protein n=1 Tax=Dactylosporangium sp. CS-033363 TaxID=3239935 RepID=UPI003D932F5F